jgi:hypothetical protein
MHAILLALASSLSAHAWTPVIACDSYGMVVDRNDSEYQLVIRNHPDVLGYFSGKVDLRRNINAKNELIVGIDEGGPSINGRTGMYVGYFGGDVNVVVSQEDASSVRVSLWSVGYRGMHVEEVANWVFRGCAVR